MSVGAGGVMRRGFVVFLAGYGVFCMARPQSEWLMSSVDLAIHETGHLVFAPFGEFVSFMGGTLFQLIVPLAFIVSFLRRGDRFAAAVVLWWVAQNLWNISVYVADARSQVLPLVGGGVHDWAYMLGRLGLLARDQSIAKTVHLAGVLVFGASIVLAWRFAGGSPQPRRAGAVLAEYDLDRLDGLRRPDEPRSPRARGR